MSSLLSKLHSGNAHVVVVGVGYVGLPLAVEFARSGLRTTGLEKNREKVDQLKAASSYVGDVVAADLAPLVAGGTLDATDDARVLGTADAVVICVPTPLNKTKEPDIRYIVEAAEQIRAHQRPDMLVVLESTTYPGTTREVLAPILTGGGFQLGHDVFLGFSPERVDPGNQTYGTKNTPKVIGGMTPQCLEASMALYSRAVQTLVPVSSTDAAEMVKLLENTFRSVNIGLVNEMAVMSRHLGLDPFEIIRAAATKPFGFMPFYPGPGLGGHCILIDPLYLSWKLRSLKREARFIDLADHVNSSMPVHVVERVVQALNDQSKSVRSSKILVYGVAYKRDIDDVRESPALTIIEELRIRGAEVSYMDPHVPQLKENDLALESVSNDRNFGDYDCVVVVTDHAALDRKLLMNQAHLIVDTRDAMRGIAGDRRKVYGL